MKPILALLALLFALSTAAHAGVLLLTTRAFYSPRARSAHASILLTTPYVVSGPSNAVPNAGTATNATVIGTTGNFNSTTSGYVYCAIFAYGTVTVSGGKDQSFTQLPGSPTITECLNSVTGQVTATRSDGTQIYNTTLTGSALTNALAIYSGAVPALRNAADLGATTTFLPGTQPDTW